MNEKERDALETRIRTAIATIKAKGISAPTRISQWNNSKPRSIPDSVAQEAEKIRNAGLLQDIELKKTTLYILFSFLAVETMAIFTIAFFQGFGSSEVSRFQFEIDEWGFRVLVVSTILQITAMLQIAVKNLFPKK